MKIHRKLNCQITGAKFDVQIEYKMIGERLQILTDVKPLTGYIVKGRTVTPEEIEVSEIETCISWHYSNSLRGSKLDFQADVEIRYYSYLKKALIFFSCTPKNKAK